MQGKQQYAVEYKATDAEEQKWKQHRLYISYNTKKPVSKTKKKNPESSALELCWRL